MLELRPTCEHCNIELPADSTEAMICTYECTFCRTCALDVLENVCPNCGGGFSPRPIRPSHQWRHGLSTRHQIPSTKVVHKAVDIPKHKQFAENIKTISPEKR